MSWNNRFQRLRPVKKDDHAYTPDPESLPDGTPKSIEPALDGEWENRILCPDESCIGIIGPEGRCTECGKPLPADPPGNVRISTVFRDGQEAIQNNADACEQQSDLDMEWESRRLCIDESCIGVIGTDGRCGVCGKKYVQGR